MSQAEELLNSLTEEDIATYTADRVNEPHIVVNPDRTITVPDELKNVAVQFDHNVETVTFDCPRYWDEHDLSTMQVFVIYLVSGKKPASYPCSDVMVDEVDNSLMHFTWTISGNVTDSDGQISFLICAKVTDEDGNLSNRWSSRLNQEMTVLKGMDASGEIQTLAPDLITNILERLDVLEKNPSGGSTVELDTTLSVAGMAADAKAVGDRLAGLRQTTAVSIVKDVNTITITTSLEGDYVSTSVVTLDDNGYPITIVTDGVECPVTWEGFE